MAICEEEGSSGSDGSGDGQDDANQLKGERNRRASLSGSNLALIVGVGVGCTALIGFATWLVYHFVVSPTEDGDAQLTAGGCLCTFDVDRTLTGQQGLLSPNCSGNSVEAGVLDTAYTGGDLTLSVAGQALDKTFCVKSGCYVGIVTAGDCSGPQSAERKHLVQQFQAAGAKLPSVEWSGPSKMGEARRACTTADATSTLIAGCLDGTKQQAVKGMVAWLAATERVDIPAENVWHFDDRENNVSPFQGTGFNARMVSCATRDPRFGTGLCGGDETEIVNAHGVVVCDQPVSLLPNPAAVHA